MSFDSKGSMRHQDKPHYGELAKKLAKEGVALDGRNARQDRIEQFQRQKVVNELHQSLIQQIKDFDNIEIFDAYRIVTPPYRDMLLYARPGEKNRLFAVFTTEWKKEGSYLKDDPKQWYRFIAEFHFPVEHKIIARSIEKLLEAVAKYIATLMQ